MSTAAPVAGGERPRVLPDGTLSRLEVVTPGMCGPNSLLAGQLGDWTWDAVSAACGVDVYAARDAAGEPTYLSFSYFRIRCGGSLHPMRLTFGDRLRVTSRVFRCGSESVLTLHRVRLDDGAVPESLEPASFFCYDDPETLYVENFNRWIARSSRHSNRDLVRAAPVGFRCAHLPEVPGPHSPRLAFGHARAHHSLLPGGPPGRTRSVDDFTVDYPVEVSRDLNGVGLLYFASYFSILDWALLRLWRALGRGDRAYLRRRLLDQRLCYLANADGQAVVRVRLTVWRDRNDPDDELVEAVLRDRGDGRVLAVAAVRTHLGEGS